MLTSKLKDLRDFFHAQFCYHLFVTPVGAPIEKQYRKIAMLACEYLQNERTEVLEYLKPRPHVIHRFSQANPNAKKILILHGWMSRAAYMARLIRALHQKGYDIYALDFPAHGDAKGMQLPWTDAAKLVKEIINTKGPFYGIIGHSFGGSMVLSTLNIANRYNDWEIKHMPEKVILLASPTRLRTPLLPMARQFKLSKKGYLNLRKIFLKKTVIDLREIGFHHYVKGGNIPVLCVHGEDDIVIPPVDSLAFCQQYPHGMLSIMPGVDHVNILFDERVADKITVFLNN